MTDIHKSLQTILAEAKRIAVNPKSIFAASSPTIPGLINTGRGGSILVNRAIETEIVKVADWIRKRKPDTFETHTLEEWRKAIRDSFGPALTQIDYKAPLDEQGKELKKLLENAADKHEFGFESRTWSMGCSLFTRPLEATFCVGPVCFEPKSTWLDRALKGNHISRTSRDRLTRAFAGQKLRPRKNTSEMAQERCILDVLETAQMACTVTIEGLAPKVGEHRSIVAARLAQATIALLWPNPSVVLSGFRLSVDHGVRLIRTIPFSAESRMIGGSRFVGMPHGPEMSSTEWNTITRNAQDFFEISGRMIACWTNSRAFRTETPLLRCLSQALFFFWEGCRDENNLMSIVEFTAALEALSQGKSSGILRLANAQLGLRDTDEFIHGKTLKQVVTLIYSEGRSRTLHGTNKKISP